MKFIVSGSFIIGLVTVANMMIYGISKLLSKGKYKVTQPGYYALSLVILSTLGLLAGWYIIMGLC